MTESSPVPAGTEQKVADILMDLIGTLPRGEAVRIAKVIIRTVHRSEAAALAAVVSSSPATPEGGRVALQERIDATLALCHRADYGGDDWPYPDHYVPASRIRDALTDIDPTLSPASPAETREGREKTWHDICMEQDYGTREGS